MDRLGRRIGKPVTNEFGDKRQQDRLRSYPEADHFQGISKISRLACFRNSSLAWSPKR